MIVSLHRTASYRFFYQPAVGDPISDEQSITQDPDKVVECCFHVNRFSDNTMNFFAGNFVPSFPVAGDCPAVASTQIRVLVPGPGALDVTPESSAMNIVYDQPDPEHCIQSANSSNVPPSTRGITLGGQVKLDDLACLTDDAGIACGLEAHGTFAFEGTIDKTLVFQLSGEFTADDTVATF